MRTMVGLNPLLNAGQCAHAFDGLGALRVEEIAERAQVPEGVDARVVTVAPAQPERVVAYLLEAAKLQVAALLELNHPRMALAAGARTVAAQYFVGKPRTVPVSPANLELAGPVGCLDASRPISSGFVHRRGGK